MECERKSPSLHFNIFLTNSLFILIVHTLEHHFHMHMEVQHDQVNHCNLATVHSMYTASPFTSTQDTVHHMVHTSPNNYT